MNRRHLLRTLGLATAGIAVLPAFGKQNYMRSLLGPGFTKADFGDGFLWGVATAAYQIEGAWNVDGKGPSIWDTFSHTKGKIKTGETGDVACDFYHSYKTDIDLIKELNLDVFRFSISWSRIFPQGTGAINPKGVEFYHNVIDYCLQIGVQPWITLYHWDLPQALQDKGGWPNRATFDAFCEYSTFVTKEYGGKVKNWMVLNEPLAYTALGYLIGIHAPGKKSVGKFVAAAHHTALAQAEGGRIIRANVPNANVGTTFSCSDIDPLREKPKHQKAAARVDGLLNRFFIEPSLGLGYPLDVLPGFKGIKKHFEPGDEEKLKFDYDFIGIQNYTRELVKYSIFPPIMWAWQIPANKRKVDNIELTDMNWEVYPEGIYNVLKKFAAYKGIDKIIVTENGAAFPDTVVDGKVHDDKRLKYYHDYLTQVLRAKKDGVNVQGYYSWTLMDNFEWAEGNRPRFGLVYTDFVTQKRIIKDSGLWFKAFLSS
jgi:beta-glucosidase